MNSLQGDQATEWKQTVLKIAEVRRFSVLRNNRAYFYIMQEQFYSGNDHLGLKANLAYLKTFQI